MDCEVTFGQGHVIISALFGPDYMAARVYTGCPVQVIRELGVALRWT